MSQEDALTVIRREDIIDDAMTEIGERVDDAGEPLPEDWRREFAEAVIGRLADDYLGAVGENEKLRTALRNVGHLVEGTHQPHDMRRMVREVVRRHTGGGS